MKKLSDLFDIKSNLQIDVLYDDSRLKVKNGLFFAIKGVTVDGHDYIESAIKNGAVAVVSEKNVDVNVPVIVVENTNVAYNIALNKFYDNVLDKLKIVSVTGTDGKTTVSEILYQLLNNYDKTGYIGTSGIRYKNFTLENDYTTPMPDLLFKAYNEFSKLGCKYVAMESSSERLSTGKLEEIYFDVAIFTNLTRDHLDTHKTMENYARAKAISFNHLKKGGLGIVNYDDKYKDFFINATKEKILTYSLSNNKADIYASDIMIGYNKLDFNINGICGKHHITTSISGEYNVNNLMCAILTLTHFGYDIDSIIKYISQIKPIEARQMMLKTNLDFNVMVDYGHTANAVRNLLKYVKGFTKGRIIAVVGAGGSRDKRRAIDMANFCTENLDYSFFTIEDARYDDPQALLKMMISEVKKKNFSLEVNRDLAIKKALEFAKKDDIVLILGKGLECYQITNGKLVPRKNDAEIAYYYIDELFGNKVN